VYGQITNKENSSAQNGLTVVSKSISEGQNELLENTELEIEKENIVGKKSQALVADEKVPVLKSDLIKDNAKALLSQANYNESGIKETLLTNKNLDNNNQTNASPKIIESLNIKEYINSLNSSKGDSAVQKIDITNIQVSTGHTKSQSDSSSDNKTDSSIDQIASHNTFAAEQDISSIANIKVGSQVQQDITENFTANVSKQILESIHSSIAQRGGDKQITVNLNPPELGQVSIKFQEQGTELTGLLEVNKTQTRSEIEQALPQIIRNLSDSGINIKRLEVVLTSDGQAGQEAMKEDTLFYNQQQQQYFYNQSLYKDGRDKTEFHKWMSSKINSVNNPGIGDSLTIENSINFLI
jgi:flagellar hook-length control protein FliK